MPHSVFSQASFWLMLLLSLLPPFAIYGGLLVRRAISPKTVALLGLLLVLIAGVDVFLLQALSAAARASPSLADDAVFTSELSVALYLFPATFGGIGVNMISHVLLRHLAEAERRFGGQGGDR